MAESKEIMNDSHSLMDNSKVQEDQKTKPKKKERLSNMMSLLDIIQNDVAICFYECLLVVQVFWGILGHVWLDEIDEECFEDNYFLVYSLYFALYLVWIYLISGALLLFLGATVASCEDGSCASDHCKCFCTCIRDIDDGSALIECIRLCCVCFIFCCCAGEKISEEEKKLTKEERQQRRIQKYSKNRKEWIGSGKVVLKGFSIIKTPTSSPRLEMDLNMASPPVPTHVAPQRSKRQLENNL